MYVCMYIYIYIYIDIHSRAFLENSAGVIGNANVNGEQYVHVVEALVPLGNWLEKGTIY